MLLLALTIFAMPAFTRVMESLTLCLKVALGYILSAIGSTPRSKKFVSNTFTSPAA